MAQCQCLVSMRKAPRLTLSSSGRCSLHQAMISLLETRLAFHSILAMSEYAVNNLWNCT